MTRLLVKFSDPCLQFLHAVKIPWFSDYDVPEKYGLAPNKTINLKIQTADNESLGAWFILADPFYHSLPTIPSQPVDYIPTALKTNPTILFFHGNAATRALKARIQHYTAFSSRLSANVLAIDYRGFGDSTGTPTEHGLARDARAAWNYLIKSGATADQILIVGHSLGTGVSALLGAELSDEGISPKGVVLLSPFSSISKVLETYSILSVIPLMKPLAMIPWAAGASFFFCVRPLVANGK
jgi:abhydrolase domain-containing protein 12